MDAQAAGIRLFAHDTLGSTNAEALIRARAGARGPLWVTAARQTAGRGRRGNAWTSEPGNLHASLLLTDTVPAGRAPELCFVAALALHDAVSSFLIPPPKGEGRIAKGDAGWGLQLKWPNDLLIDGAKFAGILIEAESVQGRPPAIAIGIGVNCAHHPADTPYPATDLTTCGVVITPETLLERLSAAMRARLEQWETGFAAIRADWLARAAGLGGDIVVRLPDRELAGKFETLDRMGRLMLRLPAGTLEAITVGEVFAQNLTPTRHASALRATADDLPLSGGGKEVA
jgi:BirA family transcriptional regulator, biotin operon repressor / biotin---[acetyl-CoA-carboxylase] ligase